MRCCIHLRSQPPYVGGDDDDTESFYAECCGCGWRSRESKAASVAYGEAIQHLHVALKQAVGRADRLTAALEAYVAVYPCPGILVEPGMTSGCQGGDDCPTHTALAASEETL